MTSSLFCTSHARVRAIATDRDRAEDRAEDREKDREGEVERRRERTRGKEREEEPLCTYFVGVLHLLELLNNESIEKVSFTSEGR